MRFLTNKLSAATNELMNAAHALLIFLLIGRVLLVACTYTVPYCTRNKIAAAQAHRNRLLACHVVPYTTLYTMNVCTEQVYTNTPCPDCHVSGNYFASDPAVYGCVSVYSCSLFVPTTTASDPL